MYTKYLRMFPRLKICLVLLAGSLLLGILAEGFDVRAFLWLTFGILMIVVIWIRNLNPNIDPRIVDPKDYDRRQSEQRIVTSLSSLIEAVNSKDKIKIDHAMDQACAALNEYNGDQF